MKLTKLQERALVCLYRRALRRASLRGRPTYNAICRIDQAAGKGAGPVDEPYDLLRWDRMDSLGLKGLLVTVHPGEMRGYVRLTLAGCREAEEIIKRREVKAFRERR